MSNITQDNNKVVVWGALPDFPSQDSTADFITDSSSSSDSSFNYDPDPVKINIERVRVKLSTSPAAAQACLDSLKYEQKGWCRCSVLKPSKSGGYIQLSWEGANKFAVLQEVVLWAAGGVLAPGEQCSHLCVNPSCMTPGHVIAETELENQRRKGCVVWVDCPHCDLKISCCNHDMGGLRAKCIKYCAGFADVNAFWQNKLHA